MYLSLVWQPQRAATLTRFSATLTSPYGRGLGARSVLYLGAVRRLGKQMDA